MKTILHLIDTTGPGGAETVFIQLADYLRERKYRSIVVIRGPGWVQEELERRGLKPIILESRGSFAIGFLIALLRIIRRNRVDLIQSHLLGSNVYAAIAGLLARVPVVATYHGMVDISPGERFRTLKHKVMRWGIKRYVAVSQRLLETIQQRGLLIPEKSVVIYNGVDVDKYRRTSGRGLKAELALPEDVILIGCLGNVRPAKAYDVLIEAGAELLQSRKDVHFVIAGDRKPSLMAKLEEQMNSLGVREYFHFIGFRQDCAEFLGQLDLFMLSSSSEGFSIATIEAMASSLPVVSTRCGGPEEIIEHGKTGFLVEANNPSALARQALKLLDNKELRESLSRKAREHAEKTFSIERMLDAYENIYRQSGLGQA